MRVTKRLTLSGQSIVVTLGLSDYQTILATMRLNEWYRMPPPYRWRWDYSDLARAAQVVG